MKDKTERHKVIREIIRDRKVANQEELSKYLEERGLHVAQATLSRDIRELMITKIHDGSGYCYSLPQPGMLRNVELDTSMTSESIESLEFSGVLAVLKTRPGHAAMIASVVDGTHLREVIGTLAGDDTVLLVLRDGFTRDDAASSLGAIFKGLDKKRVN